MNVIPALVLILAFSILTNGQNLVPNPGFEEYKDCPAGFLRPDDELKIPGWFSPNLGTPDYFNACSDGDANATVNWAGIADRFSGNGYAGIYGLRLGPGYREYLAAELLTPLDSGSQYLIQFNFRLASYSTISTGNMGMAFVHQMVKAQNDKMLSLNPTLVAMADSAISVKTGSWQRASKKYMAGGTERFLVIGNFFNSSETPVYPLKSRKLPEPMLADASYFYIDDVVIEKVVEHVPEAPDSIPYDFKFDKDGIIILRNLQFDYNKADIKPESVPELMKLLSFLMGNPGNRIEIHGHTDDQGTVDYNQQLSKKRADSVVAWLALHGISAWRMKAQGYGKLRPIHDREDEEARTTNRRVEVKLLPD